ncbi:MAG TPA: tetratricopeptide repeat protein [Candidatus Dormibacteraeota bacterium]|nr:tetratricopeptide repeat protein [Candidatus Dormibacteraeota bacterium]
MKSMKMELVGAMVLGILLFGGRDTFAQAQGAQQQTPMQGDKAPAPIATTPLTLDAAPPPVSAEEDAAMKEFRGAPMTDVAKKNQMGEDFVQKYPQSRYRVEVYSWLVKGYQGTGDVSKMEVAGEKELAIEPNDATTLAILGWMMPRALNGSMPAPDREKRLEKAEQYAKKALELVPTLPKPAGLTDEQFTAAKDQTSALAYSGLGTVAFRRGKFNDAIPNLEQAVKLDSTPDPVNYYLLGISNEKASHFDDAIAAFTKCASFPGGLQPTCKAGIEEVKKLEKTELNVPR